MARLNGRPMTERGFTLLEVMVALAVFAVVSVALVGNSASTIRQAGMIQERTVATWLAEDRMTGLRIVPRSDETFPGVGTEREIIEMAGVEWDVETEIESTENDDVRRVTVRVYRETNDEPTARLTGFLGRY